MSQSPGMHVRMTDDGFVEVQSVKFKFGVDVGSTLRFAASNISQVSAHARNVVDNESPQRSELSLGDDCITFRIGGSEHAPMLNLINRRADGSESAVAFGFAELTPILTALEDL